MSRTTEIDIRSAGAGDIPAVLGLLESAAAWIRATYEIDQWPEEFPVEPIQAAVARGSLHVAESGNEVVGTIDLIWEDELIWGERTDAGFVHRLSSSRALRGERIGERLLDWAAERIAERGRAYECLDVMYENNNLRGYYERLGFDLVGEMRREFGRPSYVTTRLWHAALYQRRVD